MLEFYRIKKNIVLTSGKKLTIQRGGLGRLFALYDLVLEQAILGMKVMTIDAVDDIMEMVTVFNTIQSEINNNLEHFAPGAGKYAPEDRQETINAVIRFNMPVNNSAGQDIEDMKTQNETPDIDDLERMRYEMSNNHLSIVAQLSEKCGWSIQYISDKINLFQASELLKAMKQTRAERVIDAAVAMSGQTKDHINNLIGIKTLSVGEFMAKMKDKDRQ